MESRRFARLAVTVLAVAAWVGGATPALAQSGRSADEARRQELMEKANAGRSVAAISAQVAAAAVGLALLSVAYTIGRKGIEVSKGKRLEGPGKWVVAALVAALGVGLSVGGVLYLPKMIGLG